MPALDGCLPGLCTNV